LVAGALLSLVAFLTLTALVTQHRFDSVDRLGRELARRPSHPLLRSSMELVSFLGGQPGQITVVVLGSVMVRRRKPWALLLPVVMAGAGALQLAAKWAIDRPRPNLEPWGFPSGHVLSLIVLFGCLAYLIGTSRVRGRWRVLGVSLCAATVLTVAYSRLHLDAHWLSDVLGGLSIGLAYLLAVIWLIGSSSPVYSPKPVLPMALGESRAKGLPTVAAIGESTAEPLIVPAAGS
jgi:undecaprenyl-diphosphatase